MVVCLCMLTIYHLSCLFLSSMNQSDQYLSAFANGCVFMIHDYMRFTRLVCFRLFVCVMCFIDAVAVCVCMCV